MEGWLLVQKVYKVHTSCVVTVPALLRRWLDINAGDYVVFQYEAKKGRVTMHKFTGEGNKDGRSKGHSDRKDKGRGTRAKDGDR